MRAKCSAAYIKAHRLIFASLELGRVLAEPYDRIDKLTLNKLIIDAFLEGPSEVKRRHHRR